jgi:hypothetical protein
MNDSIDRFVSIEEYHKLPKDVHITFKGIKSNAELKNLLKDLDSLDIESSFMGSCTESVVISIFPTNKIRGKK